MLTAMLAIMLLTIVLAGLWLTATVGTTVNLGGITVGRVVALSHDQTFISDEALAAGQAGSLTTRTDDDTGVITLGEGHGITDSDYVTVFWAAGKRYMMAVTGYDATTITVDVGAGDVLPTQDTAVIVGVETVVTCGLDGDDIAAFCADATKRAMVVLTESDDTVVKAIELIALEPFVWNSRSGLDNPLTGEAIGKVRMANGAAEANQVKVLAGYSSS